MHTFAHGEDLLLEYEDTHQYEANHQYEATHQYKATHQYEATHQYKAVLKAPRRKKSSAFLVNQLSAGWC